MSNRQETEEAFLEITVSTKEMRLMINQIRLSDLHERKEKGESLTQAEKKEYAELIFKHFMFCPQSPKNNIVKNENGDILGIPIGQAIETDTGKKYIRMFLNGREKQVPFESLIDADFSPERIIFIVAP